MAHLLEKCTVCGALLDEEDLFCSNCGTEAPQREQEAAPAAETSTHNFECAGCGASMSYDASAQALRCPFCGNEDLRRQQDVRVLRPNRVVPLAIRQEDAVVRMRQWMKSSFWRPGDLAQSALITKMTAVYVPFWVFAAKTFTYWTADTNQTPRGARGDWYPLSGQHRGAYEGLLIGASAALTPAETSAICPFDLAYAVPPEQVDLENAVFEQFRVQRKYARPLARAGLESLERSACGRYVPGRSRNVKVNVRLEDLRSEPVLLPVWIMAYRYKDKLFRFLVNGQTGKVTGQAPVSWRKITAIVAIIVAAVILAILLLLVTIGAVALHGRTDRRSAEAFGSTVAVSIPSIDRPHPACRDGAQDGELAKVQCRSTAPIRLVRMEQKIKRETSQAVSRSIRTRRMGANMEYAVTASSPSCAPSAQGRWGRSLSRTRSSLSV